MFVLFSLPYQLVRNFLFRVGVININDSKEREKLNLVI